MSLTDDALAIAKAAPEMLFALRTVRYAASFESLDKRTRSIVIEALAKAEGWEAGA